MIQYLCDTCSDVKAINENWIVGLAAEAVGATSARRELNIVSSWTRSTAVNPLAVHFCSVQCKDEYMARLFAPETTTTTEVVRERVAAPVEVVVERDMPSRKVVTKKKSRRRKSAA